MNQGSEIRVWAPNARTVTLVLPNGDVTHELLMRAEPGGWWTGTSPEVRPGTDYRFSLDGGPPMPDPRSGHQPHGVHGASRVVDHAAFPWTDDGWSPAPLLEAVIYEIHVGTFSAEGTFDGAVGRLDHLVELGVTHIELMPVNAFPGVHGWGYDGVALFAPHEPYGGPDGLKRLIDAAHEHGLGVLIDVVYNHFGPDGNYAGAYGPYQTDRYRTSWGAAVNLDGPGSDEVRRFFIDNALTWLRDYHADGLRIDAVHAFVDTSAIHLLEQMAAEVAALSRSIGRDLVLIAESDLNDPRLVRPIEAGGYGLDGTWNDDIHHAIHVTLTGERAGYYEDFTGLTDIARAMSEIYVYGGRYSAHRQRTHGRPAEGLEPGQFVGASQNHDQVGNRANGERLAHLAGPDAGMVAAALVLAGPFVPLLFQGEEWSASTPFQYFTDHRDAALGRAVSEGRRREFAAFGWAPWVPDPQDPATMARSRLVWTEIEETPHAAMLDWYRQLIRLRHEIPALHSGRRPRVEVDAEAGWILIDRDGALVAVNVGSGQVSVPLPSGRASEGRHWRLAARSNSDIDVTSAAIVLPAMSVGILIPA